VRVGSNILYALLAVVCARADIGTSTPLIYSAASIVNAASQTVEALAPNTIATIYGRNLATESYGLAPGDLTAGTMPITMKGVSVLVRGIPASMFYVSPGQINFLVPYELTAGTATLIVVRQGTAGPSVSIQLNATAPGFFKSNSATPIAVHLDGRLVTSDAPAKAGEVILLYAGGLGRVSPDSSSGRIASFAAPIQAVAQLQVLLNGKAAPPGSVGYAGLAPGFAGLYQINLTVPSGLPPNPEIRIAIGQQISPPLVLLPLQ
jgi:uncharacterized protein (TIGR03437 family)